MSPKARRKNKACSKCRTDCKVEGGYITEGGLSFYFCKLCLQILEDLPQGNKVHNFLNDENCEEIKSPITRDILKARIKRGRGKSPWCKADLHLK